MSLNIKSEQVHALARQAAAVLGTSQTSAVEQALAELLARHQRSGEGADRARLEAILADVDARLDDADRTALRDHAALYDDLGLPQ